MVCAGSAGIRNCGTVCQTRYNSPNALQFAKRDAFSWQKAPQSLDCDALQDGAAIKVRRFCHQSAALLVGESGTNAAMFSGAAAARLLRSF